MEREKQKAIEREQEELLRQQELEERKKAQEQAREVLIPPKSKFVRIFSLMVNFT